MENTVTASAPHRLDMGGTIDIATLALFYRTFDPTTVTLSLDLRVTVSIEPIETATVQIQFGEMPLEEGDPSSRDFSTPLGLYFYLCGMFRVSGVRITISSDAPVGSGLGGSGATLVALIAALDSIKPISRASLTRAEIAILAYRTEASFYSCGMQDQLAAAFGGAYCWHWRGNSARDFFRQEKLVAIKCLPQLSESLLVVYTGDTRFSPVMISTWRDRFVSGKDRDVWTQLNKLTHEFTSAIRENSYDRAANIISEEMSIRRSFWPESTTENVEKFVREAERQGCGAKFAGAGRGGSVWAIGSPERIERLRDSWSILADEISGAHLLACSLAKEGVTALNKYPQS